MLWSVLLTAYSRYSMNIGLLVLEKLVEDALVLT